MPQCTYLLYTIFIPYMESHNWAKAKILTSYVFPNAQNGLSFMVPDLHNSLLWFQYSFGIFSSSTKRIHEVSTLMIFPFSIVPSSLKTADWVHLDRELISNVRCPMDFHNYPHDTQICKMRFESYFHSEDKLMFANASVNVAKSVFDS